MRLLAFIEVLIVNVVLIALLVWITGDYNYRTAYWGPERFTPSTVRYPLLLITSAMSGSTSIPGLLTVDWQQIVLLVLVVTDAVYAWTSLRSRAGARGPESSPAMQ